MGNSNSSSTNGSHRRSWKSDRSPEKKALRGSRSKNKRKTPRRSTTSDTRSASSSSDCPLSKGEVVLTKTGAVPSDCPQELKIIRDFIRYKDLHNLAKMKELTADDCYFTFTDSDTEMPAREFYEAMKDIYASFPNLHFFWKSMTIQGVNGPESRHPGTVVVVEDYYGIGSHTGKPYFFGPYPPVDPAGVKVRDENIEFTFTVHNGKITNATIYAFGKMVGPPGFYSKIGGLIM